MWCNQKGGVHRTHSTSTVVDEPCRLDSTDLFYSRRIPIPLAQQLLTGPLCSHFSDQRCTDTTTRPTSSILFLPRRSYMYQTKKLSIAFTTYVQSRKHKLSWHSKTHKTTASAKICAQKKIDRSNYLFMHLPVHLPPSKLHLCTTSTPNFDLTFIRLGASHPLVTNVAEEISN
jgi:hypothetical protein